MTARSYHHGDLHRTLLEAAAPALERVGVEALSLRQLARDIGVSHAAPGRHFRDKQALLAALAEDGFRRLAAELAVISGEVPTDADAARTQFDTLVQCYVKFAREQPTLLALMFGMKHSPDAHEGLLEAGHWSMEIVTTAALNMQEIGAIAAGDAQEIALTIFAAAHGVAILVSGGFVDAVTGERLIARTCATLWQGLQSSESDPRGVA